MKVIKPFRGVIQNWKLLDYGYRGGEPVEDIIIGNIFGDEDRFEDGTVIYTSAIVKIDYENKKLETLNSVYELGKECGV